MEKVPAFVLDMLRCPLCMARLQRVEEGLRCVGSTCSGRFPIVDGVPVLLNESESVFSVADYLARCATTVVENETSRLSSLLWKCVPPPGRKIRSRQNLEKFGSLLMSQSTAPKVLIIGGRVAGRGMEQLLDNPAIHLVETDVAFGPLRAVRSTVSLDRLSSNTLSIPISALKRSIGC